MMRRLWCEKAEALPTGGTPREVRRRSGARLSRGVVARESARERGLPRASFASSSFSTFSGRRAFGSAAGLSRENPVGSWRVPHLSSSSSFLAMSMAPPKAAVAICAGGGAEGDGASDAPARVSRNAARTRREVPATTGRPLRRPAFRARRGKRRLPGRDRARTARAREGGGRAHRRADEPGHELLLILPPLLVGVVVSHRRSFGEGVFGVPVVRAGVCGAPTPLGASESSDDSYTRRARESPPRSERPTLRRRRVRDDVARRIRESVSGTPRLREIQKRRPCLGGAVRRRVPPPPPAAGPGVVLARVDGTVRELPDDRGRGHVPPARARSERRREGVTPPRVSRARDGVSRVAVRDETALPESSPSPASASRDPDPSMPP